MALDPESALLCPIATECRRTVKNQAAEHRTGCFFTYQSEGEPGPREGPGRAGRCKDLWLFGGGSLFRSFAELGLVDTVEVGVIPVLLGEGVPLLPAPTKRVSLKLTGHRLYAKTGIMSLEYAVQYRRGSKHRR
jgi:dihydrofolate reductase